MTLPDCDRQGLLVVTVTGAVRGPVFHRAYVCRVTLASLAPVVPAVHRFVQARRVVSSVAAALSIAAWYASGVNVSSCCLTGGEELFAVTKTTVSPVTLPGRA